MLENYFPILLFILVGLAVGAAPIFIGWLLSQPWLLNTNHPDQQKLSPYECGFEAFEDARMKFDVRYYLVAILFILFDLEIAFLFPWAIVLEEIGMFGLSRCSFFLESSRSALPMSGRKARSIGNNLRRLARA